MKNEKGYTLTELIVTMMIIGILATIITPNFIHLINEQHKKAYIVSSETIEQVLRVSYEDEGKIDTVGNGTVSDEVSNQIKHTLRKLSVRYVEKAYQEIMDNNLIKEVNNSYLFQKGILETDKVDKEKWLVFDHINSVGENHFKFYRNELFGKVMNEEIKIFGDDEIVGTLGTYEGNFGNLIIEEKTDSYLTYSGVNSENLVKMYKGDRLIGEKFGNGTFNFGVEDSVVEYKLEVLDINNEVVEEHTIKGIPNINQLQMTNVKIKENEDGDKWEVTISNDFCLSNNGICLASEEITILDIDKVIIEGYTVNFTGNPLYTINKNIVGDDLDIQVVIKGKETSVATYRIN